MKRLILSILMIFLTNTSLFAAMVVTDPGTYTYLSGMDKKLQEQLSFSQKLQEVDLEIRNKLSGNKKVGYGINSNYNFFNDYFLLPSTTQKSEKISIILKSLESIYQPVTLKINDDLDKRKYQQNAIKSSLVLSEMIINSSKQRGIEISSLSAEVDNNNSIKEAIDVNNRILLELLLETRNSNLLLANLTRAMAAKEYVGEIITDPEKEEEVKDFYNGKSDLGNSIKKVPTRGKFSTLSR